MKAIYRLNIAITAAFLLLSSSCTKETAGTASGEAGLGDERVISISYSAGTKASFNDLTPPAFKSGDEIMLSDGTKKEICPVRTTSSGQAYIRTRLTGTLKAVFPASAAKLDGNAITGVSVPATQSGKFADAIIAMADNITGTSATLNSATAILRFYVDNNIEVTSFTVTGKTGNISADLASVSVTAASGTLYSTNAAPLDPRICYVAVPAGINANTLKFQGTTNTQGTVTRECPTNATLTAAHVYNAFVPYYIDLKEYNGKSLGKWAYCNIGAFLPEEFGEYFMWGEVRGHKVISYGFATDFNSFDVTGDSRYPSTWDASKGFAGCNLPVCASTTYTTDGATLPLQDDAAYYNWGPGWRMPSKDDFHNTTWSDALPGDYVSVVDFTLNGVEGRKYTNRNTSITPKYMFVPKLNGRGEGTSWKTSPEYKYWMSVARDGTYAYLVKDVFTTSFPSSEKYYGCCIRPIYYDTSLELENLSDGGTF